MSVSFDVHVSGIRTLTNPTTFLSLLRAHRHRLTHSPSWSIRWHAYNENKTHFSSVTFENSSPHRTRLYSKISEGNTTHSLSLSYPGPVLDLPTGRPWVVLVDPFGPTSEPVPCLNRTRHWDTPWRLRSTQRQKDCTEPFPSEISVFSSVNLYVRYLSWGVVDGDNYVVWSEEPTLIVRLLQRLRPKTLLRREERFNEKVWFLLYTSTSLSHCPLVARRSPVCTDSHLCASLGNSVSSR